MVSRLPAWIFLTIGLVLIGLALLPGIRVVMGVDQKIGMQFLTVVMFLIGGLMSGLTAMLLLVRRQPKIDWARQPAELDRATIRTRCLSMHASGLLLFTGIPLLNFLVAYWLWLRHRRSSQLLDMAGQEVLNFQISFYLYLLLSLFMVIAGVGIITTPLLLAFHLTVTLLGLWFAARGRQFHYPANIPIIQGRPTIT